jgi:hypothetical protein
MSHIVTVQTKLQEPVAITAACHRLGLPALVEGKAHLYNGEATGLIVQLPGWQYPVVIDTASGTIQFDDFGGRWGKREELDRFLQAYAVEKAKLEARRKGFAVSEQQLENGSIRLQIQEGY